ncbi:MAG: hypothetical protein K2M20_03610, partial [Lachnospiraceae bacterium]|nr:hypothetical protein [Lachnospiraceae bacterium]
AGTVPLICIDSQKQCAVTGWNDLRWRGTVVFVLCVSNGKMSGKRHKKERKRVGLRVAEPEERGQSALTGKNNCQR